MDIAEEELQPLYDYVDSLPLSRPKRNIARDFADGVLVAELINHEAPRVVDLHNYSPANSIPQKLYNWHTLNQKVFKRNLGFILAKSELEAVCNCEAGAIERVLKLLVAKLEQYKQRTAEGQKDVAKTSTSPQSAIKGDTVVATVSIGRTAVKLPSQEPSPADIVIKELRETNELLTLRAEKLEQLLKLKEERITSLTAQLKAEGLLSDDS